jgi:aminocarboxymuconate-semialdehyde decarboxylase
MLLNAYSWNLESRLVDMDRDGIDCQVVCTVPVMFNYWCKADDCADLSRLLNNDMANQIARFPTRFIGLGTVPMQAPELAVEELRRCVEDLGFPGVQVRQPFMYSD